MAGGIEDRPTGPREDMDTSRGPGAHSTAKPAASSAGGVASTPSQPQTTRKRKRDSEEEGKEAEIQRKIAEKAEKLLAPESTTDKAESQPLKKRKLTREEKPESDFLYDEKLKLLSASAPRGELVANALRKLNNRISLGNLDPKDRPAITTAYQKLTQEALSPIVTSLELLQKIRALRDTIISSQLRAYLPSVPSQSSASSATATAAGMAHGVLRKIGALADTIIPSQIRGYLPFFPPQSAASPALAPSPSPISATFISYQEKEKMEALVLQLTAIHPDAVDAKTKTESTECALFLLANCRDLLKKIANPETASAALDELQTALVRYKEALSKFPKIIAALNNQLFIATETNTRLPIEKKQLLNIFGDAFLKDSGFEGDVSRTYTKLVKNFLEKSSIPLKNQKLPGILDSAIDLREGQRNLKERIKINLEAHGQSLLSGGWIGHAVLYNIKRQRDGLYTFQVFNAGEGIEYHPSTEITHKKKIQPYVEITGITEEALFETEWLLHLQDLTEKSSDSEPRPASILYSQLLPVLGGVISQRDPSPEALMTPQRSGTCAWKSLVAYLSYELGKKECKVFKFLFKTAKLEEYFHSLKAKQIVPDDLVGLKAAKEKFSGSILKISSDRELSQMIPAQELMSAQKLIEQVEELITTAQAHIQEQAQKEDTCVEGLPSLREDEINPPLEGLIKFPIASPEPIPDASTQISSTLDEKLFSWEPKPETIAADIKKFAADCKASTQPLEVLHFYDRFIEKLLERDKDNAILWTKLSQQEARDLLEEMNSISEKVDEQLTIALSKDVLDKRLQQQEHLLLNHLHMLATMHAIAKCLPTSETLLFEDYHLVHTSGILDGNRGGIFAGDQSVRFFHPSHSQYVFTTARLRYPSSKCLAYSGHNNKIYPTECFEKVCDQWLQEESNRKKIEELIPRFPMLAKKEQAKLLLSHAELLVKPFYTQILQAKRLSKMCEDRDLAKLEKAIIEKSLLVGEKQNQPLFCLSYPSFKNESLRAAAKLLLSRLEAGFIGYSAETILLLDQDGRQEELELSLEAYRDLFYIRATKEFQIPMILDYFSKDLDKLKEQDYQTILTILLFEDTILLDDLKNTPERAQQITQFLQHAYKRFVAEGDITCCLFLPRLTSTLEAYSKDKVQPFNVAENFRKMIQTIEQMDPSPKRQELLSLAHATRLASFSLKISQSTYKPEPSMIRDILLSRNFVRYFPVPKHLEDLRRNQEIETTLYYAKPHIERFMTTEQGTDALLNEMLSTVTRERTQHKFQPKPQYPLYVTENGVYQFNMKNGDLLNIKDKSALQPLPQEIQAHADFRSFFGEKPVVCQMLDPTLFEFKSDDTIQYRAKIAPSGDVTFFRKLGEPATWHQLIPINTKLPSIPKTIDRLERWVSITDTQKIYFLDPHTKKPLYIAEKGHIYKAAGMHTTDMRLLRQPDNSIPGVWYQTTLSFLTNFESSSCTHLWYNEREQKMELELPRFQLHFTADLSKQPVHFNLEGHPGYFLAQSQVLSALGTPLGTLSGFFILENSAGQKKVLIPNLPLITKNKGIDRPPSRSSLQFQASFQKNDTVYETGSLQVLEYRVDKKNLLVPQNLTARFHLAHIYLAESRYEEAAKLLQPSVTEIQERPFTQEELESLKRLMLTRCEPDAAKDIWGPACALRLHARFLYERNQERFVPLEKRDMDKESELHKGLEEEITLYLNQFNNTQAFHLPHVEETFLIKRYIATTKAQASIPQSLIMSRAKELGLKLETTSKAMESESKSMDAEDAAGSGASFDAPISKETNLVTFTPPSRFKLPNKGLDKAWYSDFRGDSDIKRALTFVEKNESFGSFYDRIQNAYTDREKRDLFMRLYPKYVERDTLAAFFLSMLFDNLKPKKSPPSFHAFCSRLAGFRVDERERYIDHLIFPITFPPYVDKWVTEAPILQAKPAAEAPVAGSIPQLRQAEREPQALPALPAAHETLELIRFNDFFTALAAPAEDAAKIQNDFAQIFSPNHPEAVHEAVVRKQYAKMQRDVAVALKNIPPAYALKHENISPLVAQLEEKRLAKDIEVRMQEAKILFLAHKVSADPKVRAEFSSGKRQYPSIEELIVTFGRKDWQKLQTQNPALTTEDIIALRKQLFTYCQEKRALQKIERCIRCAKAVQSATHDEKEEAVQRLAEELKAQSAYDPASYPLHLAYEVLLEIILREDQVRDIELLLHAEEKQVARQRIMGSGKTTVNQPLLALLCADGKRIASVIAPKALLPSVIENLRKILGGRFDQNIFCLSFSRDTKLTEEYLSALLEQLKIAQTAPKLLISDPETRHSLINALDEAFASHLSPDKSLELLRQISILLHSSAANMIDEIDQVYSPRLEHNYSTGEKKQYDPKKMALISRLVLTTPLSAHFSLNTYNRKTKNQLVDLVVNTLLKDASVVGADNAELNRQSLAKCSPNDLKMLRAYLIATVDPEGAFEAFCARHKIEQKTGCTIEALLRSNHDQSISHLLAGKGNQECEEIKKAFLKKIDDMNKVRAFIATFPESLREYLATVSVVLNRILPRVLGKVCNEQYGNRSDPLNILACPFEASKAPKTTAFASPEEQIVHSVMALRHNGVSIELVQDLCAKLNKQAVDEMTVTQVRLEETQGHKLFDQLRGDRKNIPFTGINPDELKFIAQRISANQDLFLRVIEMYLAPKIEVYESKISSNPSKLADSAHTNCGFTGTLEGTFLPQQMMGVPEEGTNGKTLIALYKKIGEGTSHVEEISEKGEGEKKALHLQLLERMRKGGPSAPNVLIDSGGFLQKIEISEFAHDLLEENERPGIKGIVFHNKKGELITLEKRASGYITVPFSESTLAENERITLIAQKYFTGTNVPQIPTARALMTVGKTMTLRDLLQGAFRMRGILKPKGQNVDLLINDEASQEIREMFRLKPSEPIRFPELLRFVATQNSYQVADNNFLAMRQKMQACIVRLIKNRILDPRKNLEEVKALFEMARAHFVHKEQNDLYPSNPSVPSFITGEQKIENLVAATLREAAPLLQKSRELCLDICHTCVKEKRPFPMPPNNTIADLETMPQELLFEVAQRALESILRSYADKEDIREIVPDTGVVVGYSVEKEQENQKETEKEKELEVEAESIEAPVAITEKLFRFDPLNWKSFFGDNTCFHKLQEALKSIDPKVAAAFDDNLSYSSNFMTSQAPFDRAQRGAYQVCYLKEPDKQARTFLLSLEDAASIKRGILDQKKREAKFVDPVTIIIYDPLNGPDCSIGIDLNPKADRLFMEQLVQIKFLNGSLQYSREEFAYLKEWIKKCGAKNMYNFFVTKVLAYKSDTKKAFMAESALKKLFQSILGSA